MRLFWRGIGGSRKPWLMLMGVALMWAALHGFAWTLLNALGDRPVSEPWMVLLGLATCLTFTMMLSSAVNQSVRMIFERGDLDLLFGSPLPPLRVITVRALAVAVHSVALVWFVLAPLAHVGVWLGQMRWLGLYVGLAALGLLAAALGIFITINLVKIVGSRRARVTAQIVGAVTGALMFLMSQISAMLDSPPE